MTDGLYDTIRDIPAWAGFAGSMILGLAVYAGLYRYAGREREKQLELDRNRDDSSERITRS